MQAASLLFREKKLLLPIVKVNATVKRGIVFYSTIAKNEEKTFFSSFVLDKNSKTA